jgi:hypothetical protein
MSALVNAKKEVDKYWNDNFECECNNPNKMYCVKHNKLKLTKEQHECIKECFGVKVLDGTLLKDKYVPKTKYDTLLKKYNKQKLRIVKLKTGNYKW